MGLLVLSRLCCTTDIVCGLPVVGQISWRIGLLEEQDGTVVAPPFQASFQSIEMHTSGCSCHTPAADMESGWGIFYLMDVFYVVYKEICTPQPILFFLHLNVINYEMEGVEAASGGREFHAVIVLDS